MSRYIISSITGLAACLIVGCQGVAGDRSITEYGSDAAVTANVKNELLHETLLTSLPIHVETDKGTVVLSGFVKNNQQKIAAGLAATRAKGARIIRNNLIISD